MVNWREFRDSFEKVSRKVFLTEAHIYLIIHIIQSKEHVGRYYLMKKLGLSEATIRSILEKLKTLGVIDAFRGGHRLTAMGISIVDDVKRRIQIIPEKIPVELGRYNACILIRGVGDRLGNVIFWRDMVIKFGGTAAIILQFKENKLIFPKSGDELSMYYPKLSDFILSLLEISDGDVLVISAGENETDALVSGLNTAFKMVYG